MSSRPSLTSSNAPANAPARRACPHCRALVNWRDADAAFSAAAEYRICPQCDEALFVAWRGPAAADATPDRH